MRPINLHIDQFDRWVPPRGDVRWETDFYKRIARDRFNADKRVGEVLSRVNGTAWSWTIKKIDDVHDVARQAEARLKEARLFKKEMVGARVIFGGDCPRKVNWQYVTTLCTLERRASGWFLVEAKKIETYSAKKIFRVHVTERQAALIRERSLSDFKVLAA